MEGGGERDIIGERDQFPTSHALSGQPVLGRLELSDRLKPRGKRHQHLACSLTISKYNEAAQNMMYFCENVKTL